MKKFSSIPTSMSWLIIFVLLMSGAWSAHGQSPDSFNYQAVIRNAQGDVLPNQVISVKITLLQNDAAVYVETHHLTTNQFGLISLAIGEGKPTLNSLGSIDWSNGQVSMQVEIDPAGGSNYVLTETALLRSVPYATYAAQANKMNGGTIEATPIGIQNPSSGSFTRVTLEDVLKLTPKTVPLEPSEGELYVNSTNHQIYCFLNGRWAQLLTAYAPTVSTSEVTNIQKSAATCGGNVTDAGGAPVTARGVCWSTDENPTVEDNKTLDGAGTGSFTSNISGLEVSITYYVRAYSTNSVGTEYGQQMSFKTVTKPIVTTIGVANITHNSAELKGTVTDDGGLPITSKGFYWSTSEAFSLYYGIEGSDDPEGFTSILTNLDATTTYYFKAYASNDLGREFGPIMSFTTDNVHGRFTDLRDGKEYGYATIGTQTWMTENLAFLPKVDAKEDGSEDVNTDKYYYVYNYTPTGVNESEEIANAKSSVNYQIYGVLYNWYAALDGSEGSDAVPSGIRGICPDGWHLPSEGEWVILETYLGMNPQVINNTGFRGNNEGGKLKEAGVEYWLSPNIGATDEYGFKARPGGLRSSSGVFVYKGMYAMFWSASQSNTGLAWSRSLINNRPDIGRSFEPHPWGRSVRCIKD